MKIIQLLFGTVFYFCAINFTVLLGIDSDMFLDITKKAVGTNNGLKQAGNKKRICILMANPLQPRWKEIAKKPESILNNTDYSITFIDLCGMADTLGGGNCINIGMPNTENQVDYFESNIYHLGYLRIDASEDTFALINYKLKDGWHNHKNYVALYENKKKDSYIVKCDITSENFKRYVQGELTTVTRKKDRNEKTDRSEELFQKIGKFDAIITDVACPISDGILTADVVKSLLSLLNENGVFISGEIDREKLSSCNSDSYWLKIIDVFKEGGEVKTCSDIQFINDCGIEAEEALIYRAKPNEYKILLKEILPGKELEDSTLDRIIICPKLKIDGNTSINENIQLKDRSSQQDIFD